MKKPFLYAVLAAIFILTGCRSNAQVTPTITAEATPTPLPAPQIRTTQIPSAEGAARQFLELWKADDYEGMYAMLTESSREAITADEFIQHFRDISVEAVLDSIDYDIHSPTVKTTSAEVPYGITLHSALVGDIHGETQMDLSLESGDWRVHWSDTLVLPELSGGNYLKMDREGYTPERANIYDRDGDVLVERREAVAVGLFTDQINFEEQAEDLFVSLSRFTGIPVDVLEMRVENSLPGEYLPLGEYTAEEMERRGGRLYNLSGVSIVPYEGRFYHGDGIAPHAIGYVQAIPQGEEDEYRRRGYITGEMFGASGLEKWGEAYLQGTRGGVLYVYNEQNQPITKLAEAPFEPAQAIYTTMDGTFQADVQRAITSFDFRGAVVVLERDTGRVLAMASAPGYDPNAFAPGNYNASALLRDILDSFSRPLYNRASQGLYPLGSVFKIITTAAGLESGVYTPETTYECGYFFEELPGLRLNDWTYEHFLEDEETQPSGLLTLTQGLIRSCNPFFWHIGLDLYRQGLTTAISDMARGFGLGSPTGIQGVDEMAGEVPDPVSDVDATNLAIGQGNLQVTPLQVANFSAAIGNGGTLYRPQLVEKIAPDEEGAAPSFTFEPEEIGQLPVSPENLAAIQESMTGVVASNRPRGTAYHVFNGLRIPIAGKTGTAETSTGEPHAWFSGYTFAEREDLPDIAIAVVVESIGEGSDYAAPIFRRVVELYFRGSPGKLYPWESSYYVEKTPTPEPEEVLETETPSPESEDND